MKFDSNRAWQEAMAAVAANRQVLVAVAGVFFLLPALLSAVFLGDAQTQVLEALGRPGEAERVFTENLGLFTGFGIGGTLVQGVGYLAVTALLSDRARPTVGQAIGTALKALPTLLAALLLMLLGLSILSVLLGLVIGGAAALLAGAAGATVGTTIALLAAMFYLSVRLSLVVPVIVNERIANPVAAMARAWRLTRHNAARLLGFFLLLTIAYVVVAFMASLVLIGPVALLAGQGQALTLFTGVVSGAISAVSSVIVAAVLAFAHRQLAGPSAEAITRTFE